MLLAPALLIPGTLFNPAVGGIGAGAANIAANAAADPTTNQLHIAVYVLETFVLPASVVGLAGLALRRSPWLATIGGGLGLIGWLPSPPRWLAIASLAFPVYYIVLSLVLHARRRPVPAE